MSIAPAKYVLPKLVPVVLQHPVIALVVIRATAAAPAAAE